MGAIGLIACSLRGERDSLLLDERIPGGDALCAEEAERHRAADQERVGHVEETVDERDLVRDLGPAKHDHEWPRRLSDKPLEHTHLAFDQQTGDRSGTAAKVLANVAQRPAVTVP